MNSYFLQLVISFWTLILNSHLEKKLVKGQ